MVKLRERTRFIAIEHASRSSARKFKHASQGMNGSVNICFQYRVTTIVDNTTGTLILIDSFSF